MNVRRRIGASLEKDLGSLQSNSNQETMPLVPYLDTQLRPSFLKAPNKHAKRRRTRRARHPKVSTHHLRNSPHLNSVSCESSARKQRTRRLSRLERLTSRLAARHVTLPRYASAVWNRHLVGVGGGPADHDGIDCQPFEHDPERRCGCTDQALGAWQNLT